MIVADTNLIIYLWLTFDNIAIVEKVFRKEPIWSAPLLWKSEFRNVIGRYLRNNLLTQAECIEGMHLAEEHIEPNSFAVETELVIDLIQVSNCSSYDCEFVALAKDLEVPLLTFDKKMLSEFPEIAIHPKDFVTE
jgi:predicted nucleic acid-binding protein